MSPPTCYFAPTGRTSERPYKRALSFCRGWTFKEISLAYPAQFHKRPSAKFADDLPRARQRKSHCIERLEVRVREEPEGSDDNEGEVSSGKIMILVVGDWQETFVSARQSFLILPSFAADKPWKTVIADLFG